MSKVEEYFSEEFDRFKIDIPDLNSHAIETKIYNCLMSRKFRRKAVCESLKLRIKDAIKKYCTERNEPINITFLQGCYKLWRLEEAPEVDWAELFALMHYTAWVLPVLASYSPGVIFDFYVDDLIMEKISNYNRDEILLYQSSFQKILDFFMLYCPENLHCKITTVSSQYTDECDFWNKLQLAVATAVPRKRVSVGVFNSN